MKCSFIDIWVIIMFKKNSNFTVTASDLVSYEKYDAARSSHQRCSVRKGALKNSRISQESTCVGVSLN